MEDLRLKHAYLKAQELYIIATRHKMLTKFHTMLTDKGKTRLLYDDNKQNLDVCESCLTSLLLIKN